MADPTTLSRLTQFSHGAGCGCKLGPAVVADLLRGLTPPSAPELLVGTETGDDAAVWRLAADRALVATTDFFTPVVDDARTWGRIAAQNAVSDVYAMGGRPLFALNLVAWPVERLGRSCSPRCWPVGPDRRRERVRGGRGHSVDDPEPKYGLALRAYLLRPDASCELRDEGLLKLFFADALDDPAATLDKVRAVRANHAEQLRQLEGIAATVKKVTPSRHLVLEYGLGLHRWALAWCDDAERRLSDGVGTTDERTS